MCFSLAWVQQILIYLVMVCAVVALLKLLLPFVLSMFGGAGGIVVQAINIFMWAIIAIAIIYFVFALIGCLLGGGSGLLLPHR